MGQIRCHRCVQQALSFSQVAQPWQPQPLLRAPAPCAVSGGQWRLGGLPASQVRQRPRRTTTGLPGHDDPPSDGSSCRGCSRPRTAPHGLQGLQEQGGQVSCRPPVAFQGEQVAVRPRLDMIGGHLHDLQRSPCRPLKGRWQAEAAGKNCVVVQVQQSCTPKHLDEVCGMKGRPELHL